jgi:hypothetical protein
MIHYYITNHPDKVVEVITLIGELVLTVFRFGNIKLSKDIINKIDSEIIDVKGL